MREVIPIDSTYMSDKIRKCIKRALERVYENDSQLICFGPNIEDWKRLYNIREADEAEVFHVSERGIVFRFGHYLQELDKEFPFLRDYSIDMEYNRHLISPKVLPDWKNGCVPDLIIHRRNDDSANLFVAEFKTWWNTSRDQDIKKLHQLMDIHGKYKYHFAAAILLEKRLEDCKIHFMASDFPEGMEYTYKTL